MCGGDTWVTREDSSVRICSQGYYWSTLKSSRGLLWSFELSIFLLIFLCRIQLTCFLFLYFSQRREMAALQYHQKDPFVSSIFLFFIVSFYSHGLTWILCYFGQCSVMGSLTKEFLKSFSSIFKLISHSSEVVKLLQLVSCLIEAIVFPEFFFFLLTNIANVCIEHLQSFDWNNGWLQGWSIIFFWNWNLLKVGRGWDVEGLTVLSYVMFKWITM